MKYFTLSFDDGVEQDKVIVNLLRKYRIKATFNLNSSMFGIPGSIEYSGTDSVRSLEKSTLSEWSGGGVVNLDRICEDEIRDVYEGFELASHSPNHERLTDFSKDEIVSLISNDVRKLMKFTNQPVIGHAYPYGDTNSEVKQALEECGIRYARAVSDRKPTYDFSLPQDKFYIKPTCRITDEYFSDLFDSFILARPESEDLLFYMWGHSYEIDFTEMKRRNFLYSFEKLLDMVASSDIISVANFEILGCI